MRLRLGLVAPFPTRRRSVCLASFELRVAICFRDLYGLGDEDGDEDGARSRQF
jgi:hypothetical protein